MKLLSTILVVLLLAPLAAIASSAAHFAFNSNSGHALLAP
jgi:pectate lyase